MVNEWAFRRDRPSLHGRSHPSALRRRTLTVQATLSLRCLCLSLPSSLCWLTDELEVSVAVAGETSYSYVITNMAYPRWLLTDLPSNHPSSRLSTSRCRDIDANTTVVVPVRRSQTGWSPALVQLFPVWPASNAGTNTRASPSVRRLRVAGAALAAGRRLLWGWRAVRAAAAATPAAGVRWSRLLYDANC